MRDNGIPTDALESGKRKVLIVDDDAELVELITDVLDRDGRFEIRTVNNGFDAGMMVKEYHPDLIVLDVMLPDINGKEVCQRVRADHNMDDVKIICISGMVEDDKIADLRGGRSERLHAQAVRGRAAGRADVPPPGHRGGTRRARSPLPPGEGQGEGRLRRGRLCMAATRPDLMSDALEAEKLAALAEFAAGAGHEINNPLTVIAGRAQLLLRGETDPERRRDLAVIHAQAMRITEMIADLRLFAAPPELERQSVDVAALVREVVESLLPAAEEQETALVLSFNPELPSRRSVDDPLRMPGSGLNVSADPVQLTVAVRALVQNALEALASGGRVEVAVSAVAGEVRIAVSDDGPGITPEQRPHIFEPFYSARQAGRGVGMGLSKCWRIVTAHGGRIEVESRPAAARSSRFACR